MIEALVLSVAWSSVCFAPGWSVHSTLCGLWLNLDSVKEYGTHCLVCINNLVNNHERPAVLKCLFGNIGNNNWDVLMLSFFSGILTVWPELIMTIYGLLLHVGRASVMCIKPRARFSVLVNSGCSSSNILVLMVFLIIRNWHALNELYVKVNRQMEHCVVLREVFF